MARWSIRRRSELDPGDVLSPIRYDAQRHRRREGAALETLAQFPRDRVVPNRAEGSELALVLDTGDALAGYVRPRGPPVPIPSLASARLELQPGDLIISRLRPYLRQVAWVDEGLFQGGHRLLCSPEFVVMRPIDNEGLAFLVPFLLSPEVHTLLLAAQEGGHHPRVPRALFPSLRIPARILHARSAMTAEVESAVRGIRAGLRALETLANPRSSSDDS